MINNRCLARVDETHWCQKRTVNGVCSTHGQRGPAANGEAPRPRRVKGKGKRRAASADS